MNYVHLKNTTEPSFTMNSLTVHPKAQQMATKGDPSVNLCKHYVFGGWFQCGPMRRAPVSSLVYVNSSVIYDATLVRMYLITGFSRYSSNLFWSILYLILTIAYYCTLVIKSLLWNIGPPPLWAQFLAKSKKV